MKKKIFTFLFAGIIFSISASSQTIRDNIDKAIKNKDAKEKSAKADVLIHKKTISDSIQIKTTPIKPVAKTPVVKKKYKKPGYRKKATTSSK